MWKRSIKGVRYTKDHPKKSSETVIIEKHLTVILNDTPLWNTISTPRLEKELAIGYLIANNHIQGITDIEDIKTTPTSVSITTKPGVTKTKTTPSKDDLSLTAFEVIALMAEFQEKSVMYKDTGIAHSASLCNSTEVLLFADDLNRFNALFKLIGQSQRQDIPFENHITVMSGKLSSDIIEILITQKCPYLISRMGITDKAYDMSQDNNMTVIGFSRGKTFTAYSGLHRVR
ncbi:hypothetical protein HOH87_06975 [bacterium]|jgi:FdhD protein|nr:hypothetical protein [bacterium]